MSPSQLHDPAVTADDRENLAAFGWTQMSLNVTCKRCNGFARVDLSDFLTPVEEAAQWECPRCRAKNQVPVLAHVGAVHKVDA